MHIHILGICGTFMGGVAVIASQAGHRVTGCDANVYPPMSDQLREMGIALIEGYDADQVALNPDLWVVGNVVTRGNPLMEAILDRGEKFLSGPQWLYEEILHSKWVLAVAGTHGKTSTSSMLASVLEHSGLRPGFLIGGVPLDFGISARLGSDRHFVIEADEYDTAFFDKRSKFVHYRPKTQILNNLEFDHADIFSELADIERQFHHLLRLIPRSGRVLVNGRDEALKRVLTYGIWSETERFGVPGEWDIGQIGTDGRFEVLLSGRRLGTVCWSQTGTHNQLNALAAIAAARHVGVDPGLAIEALGEFRGVRRRLELMGKANDVEVYDDFAHHPTAIRATIEGMRQQRPNGRILAVLEPRSQTMRRGIMKDALPDSLRLADRVFIYAAGLGWDPTSVFARAPVAAHVSNDLESLIDAVAREARNGDRVLAMSNGGFGGFHAKLLARLGQMR